MKNEVIHAGYPGDNTRAMLRRMRKDVLSHEPSCVTILCGTNDAVNPRALVPLEEFTENLNSMVSAVRETDTDLLLISPLPVFSPEVIERYGFNLPPDTDLNPEIMKYARAMRLLAERLGVPYLNLFHIFAETGMVGRGQAQSHPQRGQFRNKGRRASHRRRLPFHRRTGLSGAAGQPLRLFAPRLFRGQHHLRLSLLRHGDARRRQLPRTARQTSQHRI